MESDSPPCYLSLNRKNPSAEATTLKTATIPSQLEVPVK